MANELPRPDALPVCDPGCCGDPEAGRVVRRSAG